MACPSLLPELLGCGCLLGPVTLLELSDTVHTSFCAKSTTTIVFMMIVMSVRIEQVL